MSPTAPEVARNAIRFSPRRRTRTGGPSGAGSSLETRAGIQYWRSSAPIGVAGPTRQSSSLSSLESMAPPPSAEPSSPRRGSGGRERDPQPLDPADEVRAQLLGRSSGLDVRQPPEQLAEHR